MPKLWYLKTNMKHYLSGNLCFMTPGVFFYSLDLAAETSIFDLATTLDLMQLSQVESFISPMPQSNDCVMCFIAVRCHKCFNYVTVANHSWFAMQKYRKAI